jgi:hypothetical protein
MNFTAEQLQENFDKLISYIDKYFEGDRKEQLKKLYMDHEERLLLMPASGNINYHNCFPGGYVDHVIRVIDMAITVNEVWESYGANMNHTQEELIFAALNHDLGKIGTEQAEQYIINPSEWHRKNQGKIYTNNPVNSFMTVPDRSLKLLSDRGIKITDNEWFGIKLHDGMYEESNKPYYVNYNPESALRTNLPYILHQADMMASKVEKDLIGKQLDVQSSAPRTNVKPTKRSLTIPESISQEQKDDLMDVFGKLFE